MTIQSSNTAEVKIKIAIEISETNVVTGRFRKILRDITTNQETVLVPETTLDFAGAYDLYAAQILAAVQAKCEAAFPDL